MNGLNLILDKIEADNVLEVSKINEEGKKTAEKILEDAEATARKDAEAIIAAADKKTNLMLENAKSGCASLIKRAEASAKAEVVSECIKIASDEIKSMADGKYFEVVKKLILKYYHPKEKGRLVFGEKDAARMPKSFLKDINKEIKKQGAELTMGEASRDINSGFIICYGGVEENCTFDSLIAEKTDEIKDKLYSQLMA